MMKLFGILLIEDDEVDYLTVKRAFDKSNVANPLHRTKDAIEALELLKNKDFKSPVIILLDLNMPRMNGIEFLEVIKKDKHLKKIPIIVLTSSASEEDVTKAYENQVAGYLTKPVGMEKLIEKLSTLGKYWTLCELQ